MVSFVDEEEFIYKLPPFSDKTWMVTEIETIFVLIRRTYEHGDPRQTLVAVCFGVDRGNRLYTIDAIFNNTMTLKDFKNNPKELIVNTSVAIEPEYIDDRTLAVMVGILKGFTDAHTTNPKAFRDYVNRFICKNKQYNCTKLRKYDDRVAFAKINEEILAAGEKHNGLLQEHTQKRDEN